MIINSTFGEHDNVRAHNGAWNSVLFGMESTLERDPLDGHIAHVDDIIKQLDNRILQRGILEIARSIEPRYTYRNVTADARTEIVIVPETFPCKG